MWNWMLMLSSVVSNAPTYFANNLTLASDFLGMPAQDAYKSRILAKAHSPCLQPKSFKYTASLSSVYVDSVTYGVATLLRVNPL